MPVRRSCFVVALVILGCDKESSQPGAGAPAAPGNAAPSQADKAAAERAAIIAAENAAPPSPRPPPAPPKGMATVDIDVTGHFAKKLEGAIGMCGQTVMDGRAQGATFHVRTPELELAVLALTDREVANPKPVLNTFGPDRMSFVAGATLQGTLSMEPGRRVTIDASLRNVVGKEKIHVKGTITCNDAAP